MTASTVNEALLLLNETLEWLPNALALAACVSTGAFSLLYFTAANWRSTPAGRSLMGLAVSLTVLLAMNSIHLATGVYPGIVLVRIPVYAALAYSGAHLFFTLVRILKAGQRITLQTFIATDYKETRTDEHPEDHD